jgi:hypothetical protein
MSIEGESIMKKFTIICAIATSMQGITLDATDNTEVYRKAGYSLIEKSALASTTILVTCAVAYGLWTWWNKKPHEIKPTPPPTPEKPKIPEETAATKTIQEPQKTKAKDPRAEEKQLAKELAKAAQHKRAEMLKNKKETAAKKQ